MTIKHDVQNAAVAGVKELLERPDYGTSFAEEMLASVVKDVPSMVDVEATDELMCRILQELAGKINEAALDVLAKDAMNVS